MERTSPGCYLPGMGPPAEKFSGAWPNSGSMRSGRFYLRQPWAPPSSESDSGSWPTARTGGANRNSRSALTNRKGHAKGKSDLGLEQAADVFGGVLPEELEGPGELPPQWQRLWPTPADGVGDKDTDLTPGMATRDHSAGNLIEGVAKFLHAGGQHPGSARGPTPDAQAMNDGTSPEAWAEFCRRSKEKHGNGNGHGTTLAMATTLWQTPAVPSGPRMGLRTEEGREGQERHLEHQSVSVATTLWSTPTAKCSEGSQTHRSGERSGELLLNGQADLWSTPRAIDSMCRETLREADAVRREIENAPRGGTTTGKLEDQISLWSTPTTQDAKNDGPPSQAASSSPPLNAQASLSSLPGQPTGTPGGPSSPPPPGSPPPSSDCLRLLARLPDWCKGGSKPSARRGGAGAPAASRTPELTTDELSLLRSNWLALRDSCWERKRLNRKFVEWLMGLPAGWVTGSVAPTSFGCWVTESCRSVLLLHS